MSVSDLLGPRPIDTWSNVQAASVSASVVTATSIATTAIGAATVNAIDLNVTGLTTTGKLLVKTMNTLTDTGIVTVGGPAFTPSVAALIGVQFIHPGVTVTTFSMPTVAAVFAHLVSIGFPISGGSSFSFRIVNNSAVADVRIDNGGDPNWTIFAGAPLDAAPPFPPLVPLQSTAEFVVFISSATTASLLF